MTRRWLGATGWLLLVAAGCAYYNGLYNANRLAGEAEAAQREGRSGEARSLWGQAAVRAESVATRFSKSKWRDDALLLWGRGLKESGACRSAQAPLRLAVDSSPDAALRQRARLLLGECRVELRQYDSAVAVLTPVVAQGESDLARRALWWRGRAGMALGDYTAAVRRADPDSAAFDLATGYTTLGRVDDARAALQARVPGPYDEVRWLAAFDLATGYTTLGRVDDARAALQARVPGPYDEVRWLGALDSLGEADPWAAAELVDQLAVRPDLTVGERARLFLNDGERWEAAHWPGQRRPTPPRGQRPRCGWRCWNCGRRPAQNACWSSWQPWRGPHGGAAPRGVQPPRTPALFVWPRSWCGSRSWIRRGRCCSGLRSSCGIHSALRRSRLRSSG